MNEIKKWEYVTSFYRLATIYILHAKCELKMFKFLGKGKDLLAKHLRN